MDLYGKEVLVLGLGASGLAAARLLRERGARVIATDSASGEALEDALNASEGVIERCETGGHSRSFCSSAELVVASPGIDTEQLIRQGVLSSAQTVIGEIELAWRFCKARVVAVTGTNGKSTTVSLTQHILRSAGHKAVLCGNIGVPFSAVIPDLSEGDVAVLEVSSYQLQTVRTFAPDVAVLLNIAPDHIKRHGDMRAYALSKFRIFSSQRPHQWALLHHALEHEAREHGISARKLFFGAGTRRGVRGLHRDIELPGLDSSYGPSTIRVCEDRVRLKGPHNLDNIQAAAVASSIMGASSDAISAAVESFRPLSHRTENVGSIGPVEFINDSKATNIDAVIKALDALSGPAVLIAGGRDKGDDYARVLPHMRGKVLSVIVMGESSGKIARAFSSSVSVSEAANMKEAVEKAFAIALPSSATVLFSPMCSSFDMYENFAHRGSVFAEEVRSLSKKIEREPAGT